MQLGHSLPKYLDVFDLGDEDLNLEDFIVDFLLNELMRVVVEHAHTMVAHPVQKLQYSIIGPYLVDVLQTLQCLQPYL